MENLFFLAFQQSSDGAAAAAGIQLVVQLILAVVVIASQWVLFGKAGKPGWASIIPIYNTIVLLEIVGRPLWWIVLLLIPFVNIVILIIVLNDLSKSFGKGVGFTVGLILLSIVFFPLLAFGDAQYIGPAAAQ
jgi:hypothetical protein